MPSKQQDSVDKYNELMSQMSKAKDEWDKETDDGLQDDQERLLSQAIDLAIEQGRGWSPGEKEAYLEKILDDDFVPPMFATSQEEVEKSGLQDAFTSLIYDGESPTSLMLQFRKKGNEMFSKGSLNQVGNNEYLRTAVNHYYEAFAWAQKIVPMMPGDLAQADTDDPTYTEEELNAEKAVICSNIALVHMKLKNWGMMRDESNKALGFDKKNIKAWYRFAKAHQMLKNWEEAGDAIDAGLELDADNKELKKLQTLLQEKVRKARLQRQQRERARAERVAKVKSVWKHCKDMGIKLGRVPLVTSITDDDEDEEEGAESRWLSHLPHTGVLPSSSGSEWSWPCMFLYPSHNQSDFIKDFGESEMIALRMAQMFPELDPDEDGETAVVWDYNNEFSCSNLAVYFEVHDQNNGDIHPDSVELLKDQASCMRFYESSRALRGDEGVDMANVVRAVERKHLYILRRDWKKKHGSLWATPDPNPVVRVHPAATLNDVLTDSRMMVPNFLVTFFLFPEHHPAHEAYLKEHRCLGILEPKNMST